MAPAPMQLGEHSTKIDQQLVTTPHVCTLPTDKLRRTCQAVKMLLALGTDTTLLSIQHIRNGLVSEASTLVPAEFICLLSQHGFV